MHILTDCCLHRIISLLKLSLDNIVLLTVELKLRFSLFSIFYVLALNTLSQMRIKYDRIRDK